MADGWQGSTVRSVLENPRAAGRGRRVGCGGIAKLERDRSAAGPYLLRGLVRCKLFQRRMQGGMHRERVLYRCVARRLAPGSAALADHPKMINLR